MRPLRHTGAIYFQVPYETPTSGTANFIVTQVSTGAILAVGTFPMAKTNPGFFTSNAQGFGAVAAVNSDGTVNGPNNQAARGSFVTLYLTGLGQSLNAPADGYAPQSGNIVNTPSQPVVILNRLACYIELLRRGRLCGRMAD